MITAGYGAGKLAHWRDVVLLLVRRDFRGRYKHTKVGLAWSVASPLMFLIVFYILFTQVLSLGIPNYASFVFVGILAWQWTQGALSQSVGSISNNAALVNQPGFPISALPVIAVVMPLLNMLIAFPLLLVLLWVEGVDLSITAICLPLIIAVQFLATLSIAYVVAAANVAWRDVEHALPLLLNLGHYATPVFWGAERIPEQYHWLVYWNPYAVLIENYRRVLLRATWPDWQGLAILSLAALVLLYVGLRYFNHARFRFLEEL